MARRSVASFIESNNSFNYHFSLHPNERHSDFDPLLRSPWTHNMFKIDRCYLEYLRCGPANYKVPFKK